MEKKNIDSVFEKYLVSTRQYQLFVWAEPKETLTIAETEIVCEGELKESDLCTGALHSSQYFVATKDLLVRCAVTHSI